MKKITWSVFLLILSINVSFSQTPTPSLDPAVDSDVVKITTALIQLDVTVTDKNGNIVTNLESEDFEVFENDKKQTVTNFSFIDSAPETETPKTTKPNKINVPGEAVRLRPEQVSRTIALVVDDLGLSAESMQSVKKALKKFVDEQMQPNDLVAIIRTGSGIGSLQQFTADKNLLYKAIEKIRWNPIGRAGVGAFTPIEPTLQELIQMNSAIPSQAGSGASSMMDDQVQAEKDRIAVFNELRENFFTIGTLGSIGFVVKGMSELPGRKSIMLFSDGFSYCTKTDTKKDAARCTKMEDALKQLTDVCNRASVTIYTQDARGLTTMGLSAQDSPASLPNSLQKGLGTRSDELRDKQQGLAFLAEETGGRAVFNNNDLNLGLAQMLKATKGFYLIGYQPDSESFDPKTRRFNKLTINVKQPGFNVSYRSGFFGVADSGTRNSAPQTETPLQQLLKPLTSPFTANDISLKLNTLFGKDEKNNSFIRSFLHIDARDLTFTDAPDGQKQATFDVLAISYGETGAIIDQVGQNYTIIVKTEKYQKTLDDGFVYNFVFPIKKPDAYQMRVSLRDAASGKVGSANQFIEVPDLKSGKLSLSGIVLENFTETQWKNPSATQNEGQRQIDLMQNTSLRRFKRGTILSYTAEIYNAKLDSSKKPELQTQIRLFRDGKLILDGIPKPFVAEKQGDTAKLEFAGALGLGNEMKSGDYVLQIVIIDKQAKAKRGLADQWVQFELID